MFSSIVSKHFRILNRQSSLLPFSNRIFGFTERIKIFEEKFSNVFLEKDLYRNKNTDIKTDAAKKMYSNKDNFNLVRGSPGKVIYQFYFEFKNIGLSMYDQKFSLLSQHSVTIIFNLMLREIG